MTGCEIELACTINCPSTCRCLHHLQQPCHPPQLLQHPLCIISGWPLVPLHVLNGTFCSVLSPLLWGHSASFYFFYKVGFCDIYWIHSLKRFVLQVATSGYFNFFQKIYYYFPIYKSEKEVVKRRACLLVISLILMIISNVATCHLAIAWAKMPRRRQNDMGFF